MVASANTQLSVQQTLLEITRHPSLEQSLCWQKVKFMVVKTESLSTNLC